MENKTKIFFPFNHGFMLHSEYLHHEEYFEDDTDDDLEIDEEEDEYEYDSWKELLKQDDCEDRYQEEEDEKFIDKLDSPRYPIFMRLEAFKEKIEILYPTILWKQDITEIFEDKQFDFLCGEIYTSHGFLMILAVSENDILYRPLRIDVKFTDYPYTEVRKISKFLNTYLFHFNSLQYLDVEDDGEIEKDLFQSYH